DDHASGAAVDAQGAAGADVFVDDEEHVVLGVVAGLVGVDGFVDGVGGQHVDAFPRADVDAAFAQDAFGLVDVQELLGFDRLSQPFRGDLLQHIRGRELRHRRIRISTSHSVSNLPRAFSRSVPLWLARLRPYMTATWPNRRSNSIGRTWLAARTPVRW